MDDAAVIYGLEDFQDRHKLLILYGSQTGTAHDVAERIGRQAWRYYFHPFVKSMNEINLDQLIEEQTVIFVASTTGQGEDPDNMKSFFQSLWKNRTSRSLLSSFQFAVLGLGDSSYKKFNFSAKRLNKLLIHLGGISLLDIGLADDQHDLGSDYVVDKWLKQLWGCLVTLYKLPIGMIPIVKPILLPPKYKVDFLEIKDSIDKNILEKYGSINQNNFVISNANNPCCSTLTNNLRKTSINHFQDVRLFEFDVSSIRGERHKPGDVLMIQPQNLEENTEEFINILDLDSDKLFSLNPFSPDAVLPHSYLIPRRCSVRECVKKYFDIQSIPSRFFFELLSFFTKDENEKEKFLEFTTSEGQEDFYNYCLRPKRTILEVLADFPNTAKKIPFVYLFDLIPGIKARPYSIASSSLFSSNKVQILSAVVNYRTTLKKNRIGLCSNFLSRLESGAEVLVWVKPGSLTFPKFISETTVPPVIMICPGTGCAPFRSYIQERIALNEFGALVVIFGCRGKNLDFFFKEEWEQLVDSNKIKLFCAFSRDQNSKEYVQHIMIKHALYLWNLISECNAQIYYAGNAKRIPIDVYEALQNMCQVGGQMSSNEAEIYMKKNVEKRYQTESWA